MLATHAPENTDNNDSLKYFGCIWHVTNKIPKKLDFSRQFDLTCWDEPFISFVKLHPLKTLNAFENLGPKMSVAINLQWNGEEICTL